MDVRAWAFVRGTIELGIGAEVSQSQGKRGRKEGRKEGFRCCCVGIRAWRECAWTMGSAQRRAKHGSVERCGSIAKRSKSLQNGNDLSSSLGLGAFPKKAIAKLEGIAYSQTMSMLENLVDFDKQGECNAYKNTSNFTN